MKNNNATMGLLNATDTDYLSYLIGLVIALAILGYLIYTLVRPEKF